MWSSDSCSVIDVGFAEEEVPVSIRGLEQNFEPVQSLVTTVLWLDLVDNIWALFLVLRLFSFAHAWGALSLLTRSWQLSFELGNIETGGIGVIRTVSSKRGSFRLYLVLRLSRIGCSLLLEAKNLRGWLNVRNFKASSFCLVSKTIFSYSRLMSKLVSLIGSCYWIFTLFLDCIDLVPKVLLDLIMSSTIYLSLGVSWEALFFSSSTFSMTGISQLFFNGGSGSSWEASFIWGTKVSLELEGVYSFRSSRLSSW